jgi:hypothetical protein
MSNSSRRNPQNILRCEMAGNIRSGSADPILLHRGDDRLRHLD